MPLAFIIAIIAAVPAPPPLRAVKLRYLMPHLAILLFLCAVIANIDPAPRSFLR